ncbi:hypothetical protein ARMSODRAFT_960925 [Armillaria solidipes]|uniref:Uncharacterized protein n=1 Tax=Armillaria solidipes TaxID=1076256 RepID=A0A2H3BSE2_9AGAR|nr:hypothetical protein ARMSODRAFT_960925 [Armillaria solidipes]
MSKRHLWFSVARVKRGFVTTSPPPVPFCRAIWDVLDYFQDIDNSNIYSHNANSPLAPNTNHLYFSPPPSDHDDQNTPLTVDAYHDHFVLRRCGILSLAFL